MLPAHVLPALASLTLLGFALGAALGVAARLLRVEADALAEELTDLLPGSQCGQCGYPGCGPAAAALAAGEAPVSLCPPGGRAVAEALAARLGSDADLSALEDGPPRVGHVDEALCTGCMKCFKRCATDAIVGAPKMIHAVFPEACTGCGACALACPEGAITLAPVPVTLETWFWPRPDAAPSPSPAEAPA